MTLVVDKINHYNSIINKIIKFQLSLNTYRKRLIFLIIKAMQFQNIFVSYDEKIYSIKKKIGIVGIYYYGEWIGQKKLQKI